jgi:hypothetical protein
MEREVEIKDRIIREMRRSFEHESYQELMEDN